MRLLGAVVVFVATVSACAGPRVVTSIASRGDTVFVAWAEQEGGQGVIACTVKQAGSSEQPVTLARQLVSPSLENCRHLRVIFGKEDAATPLPSSAAPATSSMMPGVPIADDQGAP